MVATFRPRVSITDVQNPEYENIGPWRFMTFDDQPERVKDKTVTFSTNGFVVAAPMKKVELSFLLNGGVFPLTLDTTTPTPPGIALYTAPSVIVQATAYPKGIRFRVMLTVKGNEVVNSAAIRMLGIEGNSTSFNYRQDGDWDGRIKAKCGKFDVHFLVEDAKEKYPKGYSMSGNTLLLYLHHAGLQQDQSRDGVRNLEAFCTGPFSTTLPPGYVDLLRADPEISQAAKEISVEQQAAQRATTRLSMDFWIARDVIEPQSPEILLDTFKSPIWQKPRKGIGTGVLGIAEGRIHKIFAKKLANGPRGTVLYGDFPHDPTSYFRVRSNNHYFHCTTAWRGVLRKPAKVGLYGIESLLYGMNIYEYYPIARVMGNYLRDQCWITGWQSHGKGLAPWTGPYTVNGHWCDSEALLMAWLVDQDYLSLMEYQKWMNEFKEPTSNNREACTAKRMCDVASWYMGTLGNTAEADKWQAISNRIDGVLRAEIERIKATPAYKDYGAGLPTGTIWHPLWPTKPLKIKKSAPEGILNVVDLVSYGRIKDVERTILHGVVPPKEVGFGPLGEMHVGLQMELLHEAFLVQQPRVGNFYFYGTTHKGYAKVSVIKNIADVPLMLTIALGNRQSGDIQPQIVKVTRPDGTFVNLTAMDGPNRFPRYVDSGVGWVIDPSMQGDISGWQVAEKTFFVPDSSETGVYVVEVGNNAGLLLHGPISMYDEWQDVSDPNDYRHPGQGEFNSWPPTSGVLAYGSGRQAL